MLNSRLDDSRSFPLAANDKKKLTMTVKKFYLL